MFFFAGKPAFHAPAALAQSLFVSGIPANGRPAQACRPFAGIPETKSDCANAAGAWKAGLPAKKNMQAECVHAFALGAGSLSDGSQIKSANVPRRLFCPDEL